MANQNISHVAESNMSALPILTSESVPENLKPAQVYLSSLAPTGRRAIKGRLKSIADMFDCPFDSMPWHELRYEHLSAIRTQLQEGDLAPSTINMTLYGLRGVAKSAFNLGLMSADDYARLCNVKPVKGERIPAGRALSVGEIGALLDTCAVTPIGIRNAVIISIMYACGLRRDEVVSLDLDHYNTETGELKVKGKGNKERLLYVDNGALEALNDWLSIRGDQDGALFNPILKGGKIQNRRMTNQAIYNLLLSHAKEAGIARFSPHDLRRSFISELLDRGADVVTVQGLAGHASVQTTARYDRRGERAKKKAIGLLHVPYKKRTYILNI
jgi:site-specific recombinase XerD